jgi:hypothetical protein
LNLALAIAAEILLPGRQKIGVKSATLPKQGNAQKKDKISNRIKFSSFLTIHFSIFKLSNFQIFKFSNCFVSKSLKTPLD